MAELEEKLRGLLVDPKESLNVELKQWLSPTEPEGIAKIAKGCIAHRNNDGGHLVIGIRDDGSFDTPNAPADTRRTFHPDIIQAIVGKYSSELFEVTVSHLSINGSVVVGITVPSGVRSPVAAKADLFDSSARLLLKDHAIYVRSLSSNATFSSAEARRGDWERLTRICFDNREADIGAFLRRHLMSLDLMSLADLVPQLNAMLHKPTNDERIVSELNRGRELLYKAGKRQKLRIPDIGLREAAILVDGDIPPQAPNKEFLFRVLRGAPQLSGWPVFVDLSAGDRTECHPHVAGEGW